MGIPKICQRCGNNTFFTKMSMLDYFLLCYPCRKDEDNMNKEDFDRIMEQIKEYEKEDD